MAKENMFIKNNNILNTFLLIIVIVLLLINTCHIYGAKSETTVEASDSKIEITQKEFEGDLNNVSLRIITRDEWLAQPQVNELDQLVLPVDNVIFAHTALENCSTQAICTLRVRLIQTFHMESKNWNDIGSNFLVGGDGAIYEGRGWDKQGAHTKGYNNGSIGIAFIGTFNTIVPPEKQLQAAKLLLEEGVRLKKLSPDYKIYGQRQLIGSESPGKSLFEILKTWPHFSNSVVLS